MFVAVESSVLTECSASGRTSGGDSPAVQIAGGDSPAVQIVLQFSAAESCPSVTVNIRRKTKRLNSVERHLTTEEAEASLQAKANGNRLYS